MNTMKTKYGTAQINNRRYYQITSTKEGNFGKLLHRLIFEDYHNCTLDSNDVIHHIDFDTTNNHPTNLTCMSPKAHNLLHHKGKNHSEETKTKMSESHTGKTYSEEAKMKMSESHNTSGYLNVCKHKCKTCKQGYVWNYQYYDENRKRKSIASVDIKKLEKKVKAKGLPWEVLN